MNQDAVRDLKFAFQGRLQPQEWVRDDLHPVDLLDATDFVEDIQAGKDRALLFQSAIPYFAFLTDEARAFLLPDYVGTIATYESHIIATVCDLDSERDRALLGSLNPDELTAVLRFIEALSGADGMQFYLEDIRVLTHLVQACRAGPLQ